MPVYFNRQTTVRGHGRKIQPELPGLRMIWRVNEFRTWVLAGLLVLLFLGVTRLFAPFFSVLLWSALLYVLFSPLYHRIVRKLDMTKRTGQILRNLLAAFFSVMSVVIIVVPLIFIAVQMGKQLSSLIKMGLAYLESNPEFPMIQVDGLSQLIKELSFGALDISHMDVKQKVIETLSGGADQMVRITTSVVRNVGAFVLDLLFLVFSLFFFYVDGEYLLKLFVGAVPIRNDYALQLIHKFRDITRNLFLGYFLVSAFQALAAYIIFSIFRVEGALAFSILLMFCSFIPMIGAGTVWLPLGMVRILSGDLPGGLLFLALCAIFVSTLDNFLRPLFLRDRIHLHPLIIFFSILGGVAVFGFNGLVVGPMIVIFFLTVLDLFLIEHGIDRER